jgi:hypothetical protein
MKWFIIPCLALPILFGACEKHPAADLPPEGATAFGEHGWPKTDEKAEVASTAEPAPAAKTESAPPVAEGKPGEAPKFFPENK